MANESFATAPLSSVVPAYLYQQYADDPDLQSFFAGLNATAQGYTDWFNQTPLSVYTNASINGPLLDWVGQGLYGISRPVVSTLATTTSGEVNSAAVNAMAVNRHFIRRSGSVSVASDDIYKRLLTWCTYLGDGRQASIHWLRRRVARFVFGENGTDTSADNLVWVSITRPSLPSTGAASTIPVNTAAIDRRRSRGQKASHALQITVPNTPAGVAFEILVRAGYIALPFQVQFTVLIAATVGALDTSFVLDQSALA